MIPILPDTINASPALYAKAARVGSLMVSNIFYTFQGEGPWAGNPAVFIRLAGCNLGKKEHCPWCDADFRMSEAMTIGPVQIIDFIVRKGNNAPLFVLTGGEPLLQLSSLEVVIDAVQRQCGQKLAQFETNGILLTDTILSRHPDWAFVVSPKILRDGLYSPIPAAWRLHRKRIALKYVVSADSNNPYHNIPSPQELSGFNVFISGQTEYGPDDALAQPGKPAANLLLMSEYARTQTAANYAYAAQIALAKGYRVSYQTHLLAGVE